jgi:hypothetical protein
MSYKELLKEYNFEKIDLDEVFNSEGYEAYREVYIKEIQHGEAVQLGIYSAEHKLDIAWSASGIDLALNREDSPPDGWMVDDCIFIDFFHLLREVEEIRIAFYISSGREEWEKDKGYYRS